MINKKNYIFTLLLTLLWTACSHDEGPTAVYDNAYPLAVKAQNVGFEADQAADLYAKGESIGVSMLEEGTNQVVEPYFNIRFNSGGIGSYFTVGNNDSIPMFPAGGEKRDLAAYYPRVDDVTDNQINIDLSAEQNLAFNLQFDKINGLSKDNREADFKLKHVFAMVSAEITPEVSYSNMKVEIRNTTLKGSLNVLDGTLTESETGTLTLSEVGTLARSGATSLEKGKFVAMLFPVEGQGAFTGEGTAEDPAAGVSPTIVITLLDANNAPIAAPIELNVADYISTLPSAIHTKFEIAIDVNLVPTVKVTSYPITVDDWEMSGEIGVDGNEELK